MSRKCLVWIGGGCLLACLPLASQTVQLAPASLSFGSQTVGTTSDIHGVSVSNPGLLPVTITAWNLSGAGFSIYSADALPLTLPAGGTTAVNLLFTPTVAQSYQGMFSVLGEGFGAVGVPLAGIGAAPQFSLVGSTVFPGQPAGSTSSLQVVYLENSGTVPVTVTSINLAGAAFAIYSHTPLPAHLNPGEATGITVSFSPPSAGAYSSVLTAVGTGSASATLTGVGIGTNPISVTSGALELALGQPAAQTLRAIGGMPPYRWSLYWSSPALPPGLSLAADGTLSGVPNQSGSYSVVVSAGDSSSDPQWVSQVVAISVSSQAVDAYGGNAAHACGAGPQPHFYTAQVNGRWWLCTPAGNVFWMTGVYDAVAGDTVGDYQGIVQSNLVAAKYATGITTSSTLNWSLETARRLQSWGFNTLGEYSLGWLWPVGVDGDWGTADNTIPVKLPFVGFESPSLYSLTNSGGYAPGPTKDLVAGVNPAVFSGYRSSSPDVFDPNWQAWLVNSLARDPWAQAAIHATHNDFLVGFNIDDGDNLLGFGAGADFPTVANGGVAPGAQQPHLGWIVLVTAPTQSANASLGQTYTDATVYAKQAMSQWLAARYNQNIVALDTAWGASYTSFGSAGGWGQGSGVLDEDGTCPAARGGACWVPSDPYTLSGATPAMQQDLDAWLLYHAQQYFSVIRAALNAAAPGVLYLGPTTIGSWGAPPRRQILQAAAQYTDVLMLPSLPPDCSNCTDIAARMRFVAQYAGAKPWINWEGYQAKSDSYMSPYASTGDELQTQAARAALYQSRLAAMMSYPNLVGLKWWALYDSRGESANWGLITNRDDPYDGSATPNPGVDAWGYPTGCLAGFGCEQGSYGNFLAAVAAANLTIYTELWP